MLHRNFMRRGVSLEVILEEDDNAEVSFDPIPFEDETDSNSSSHASSNGPDGGEGPRDEKEKRGPLNNFDRLREEKERRKRRKEEEDELWRGLEKQRSLSCETLTILDVGDDEFSREQWEEEARNWDVAEGKNGGHQIEHSISRKKILLQAASRNTGVEDDDQYDSEPENREMLSEEDLETASSSRTSQSEKEENRQIEGSSDNDRSQNSEKMDCVKPDLKGDYESRQGLTALREGEDNAGSNTSSVLPDVGQEQSGMSPNDTSGKTRSDTSDEKELPLDYNLTCNQFPEGGVFDPFCSDVLSNEEDSWITVGELETGSLEPDEKTDNDSRGDSKPDATDAATRTKEEEDDEEEEEKEKGEEREEPSRQKSKGVRFREEPEYVNERAELVFIDDDDDDDPVRMTSGGEKQILDSPLQEESPHLLDVRAGRELFEASSGEGRTDSPPIYDRLTTALENTRVLIVEKPPSPLGHTNARESPVPSGTFSMSQTEANTPASPSSSTSSSSACFNTHNAELHPEELPPPHTVASVRQLFEQIPAAVTFHNDAVFEFQSRFEHVRSNPSSKILRFDRERHSQSPIVTRSTSSSSSSSSLPKNFKEEAGCSPHKKGLYSLASRPSEDYCSTGIHLRKPRLARGFDVRKALRENPRYFHIRFGERSKEGEEKLRDKSPTGTKAPSGRGGTITYSYVEAKHQSQRGSTTALRWTKETIDRSDAESMSSESSEDSGVSKDFSSSIITSFSKSSSESKKATRWSCPGLVDKQFASDPSFKWIDPTVLAKIRSRGTTVIYFGPRHRPPGAPRAKTAPWWSPTLKGNVLDGNKSPASTLTQIVEREDENDVERGRGGVHTYGSQPSSRASNVVPNTQVTFAKKASYTLSDSPKIVGIKHKSSLLCLGSTSGIRGHRSPDRDIPKIKPFPHRDSIFLPKREAKNKSTGNNSIVYDFTQRQQTEDEDSG